MGTEAKTAAFIGGELKILADGATSREAVLALPLSRLLMRMVRVKAEEDPVAVAEPVLKALSPFPDESLTVSCELVSETEGGEKTYIAAALPEGATDDLATALDAAKLNVTRVDALPFGALRGDWGDLKIEDGQRRLVRLTSPDDTALIVLDGDQPVAIRALVPGAEEKRETMLVLLEAEDFNGPKELAETIERTIDIDAALVGIRDRAAETATLNALPSSWAEVLAETRFKSKMTRNLAIAGGIWALALAVLFGVPMVYGFLTDRVKADCRAHERAYRAVAEKKEKVNVVQQYSDHSRGALEILKAVSDRLPEGITLTSWDFSREDGLRLRGDSDNGSGGVYAFKDAVVAMGGEDDPVFKVVSLGKMDIQKDGKQKFDLTCKNEEEAAE